jgi:hypothetical protein
MRYLIKPCLLIQVGLSLLVNKNQVYKSDKVEIIVKVVSPERRGVPTTTTFMMKVNRLAI